MGETLKAILLAAAYLTLALTTLWRFVWKPTLDATKKDSATGD